VGDFPFGTTVLLTAFPAWHSTAAWTGCIAVANQCSVEMISEFDPKVTFSPHLTVQRSGPTTTEHNTIQSAYDVSAPGDVIYAQNRIYYENLVLNLPVDIELQGGVDGGYQPAAGMFTIIAGSLAVSGGKVTLNSFVIR
jgi:hypothetical protein